MEGKPNYCCGKDGVKMSQQRIQCNLLWWDIMLTSVPAKVWFWFDFDLMPFLCKQLKLIQKPAAHEVLLCRFHLNSYTLGFSADLKISVPSCTVYRLFSAAESAVPELSFEWECIRVSSTLCLKARITLIRFERVDNINQSFILFFSFFSSGYGSVDIEQVWSSKAVDTAHSTVPVSEAAPVDTLHSTVPVSEAVPVLSPKEVSKPRAEVVHNKADSSSSTTEKHKNRKRHITVQSQKRKRWDSTSEDNDANKSSSLSKRSKKNTDRRRSSRKSPDRHNTVGSTKKGDRDRRTSGSSVIKSDPPSRRIVSGFKGGSLQITILRGQQSDQRNMLKTNLMLIIFFFGGGEVGNSNSKDYSKKD